MSSSRYRLTIEQRSPLVKNKLDSIMARLGGLCSQGGDDALQGGNEHERWAKLFQYAVAIGSHPRLC